MQGELRKPGCEGYVAKPFDPTELLDTIRNFLP